ncbi:MAG: DUF4411 family protein [Chitinophagales bacterium]
MQTVLKYGDTYCVDMGILIKLDFEFSKKRKAFKAIWDEIELMVEQGEMFSCEFLDDEVNRYTGVHTFIQEWLKDRKDKFLISNDLPILIAASQVINENLNTGFLKKKNWESGQNESDPYLIALGMVLGCKIITTESKDKSNKIPQVAKKYGVTSIDLYEFFDERGLKMMKSMS